MKTTLRQFLATHPEVKISKIHTRPSPDGAKSFCTLRKGHGPKAKVVLPLIRTNMDVEQDFTLAAS